MPASTLTVELFTEELPPKALKRLGESFAAAIADGLAQRGFRQADSQVTAFATPRRLAVSITRVLARSPDQTQRVKLLPVAVGFDAAGQPTMALLKKLASLDLDAESIASLERASDGKALALFISRTVAGELLCAGLEEVVAGAIDKLPIPKVMTYQRADGVTVKFARPAHRLLALHGADVVPIRALGLTADRVTGGHRFLGRSDIAIATASAYDETLRAEGKVIAGYAERRAAIVAGLKAAAGGATVIMPDALLDEVTSLVEWPAVYAGSFDPAFLDVPQECLILTMQQNQKYFALADANGKLIHRFLLVSNLATHDPSAIIQGNERVLRARLADARFFFDQDRKSRLETRLSKLEAVVYHNRIGSQRERIDRVLVLAGDIAGMMGIDRAQTERAALLAKADLVTDMVGEFPELQGLMGRYYAQHDGEAPAIAAAIEQHYWPRFAGDALPEGPVAQALALADKLESLAGLFGIGSEPTGDKDPFGLRRAALGVIRILIEKRARAAAARTHATRVRGFRRHACRQARDREPRAVHLRPAARRAARPGLHGQPDRGRRRRQPGGIASRPGASRRGACVRGAARGGRPCRCQQAHRKHPEEVRRRRGAQGRSGAAGRRRGTRPLRRLRQTGACGRSLLRRRRLRERAAGAGDGQAGSRPLLRRRDGDGRRRRAPRQSAGTARWRRPNDEPRGRHLAPRGLTRAPPTAKDTMVQFAAETVSTSRTQKLIVLDRDGVINHDSAHFIKTPEEWRPIPGSLEAIARLNHAGYRVVVATNQSGIGRGLFDMATLNTIHEKMHKALAFAGGRIDALFYCPHTGDSDCECRKPRPGMLREIGQRFGVDMAGVACIGDSLRDLLAAEAVGGQPMLVLTGKGEKTLREGNFPKNTVIFPDLAFAVSALLANE